jgi:acetyltransferase
MNSVSESLERAASGASRASTGSGAAGSPYPAELVEEVLWHGETIVIRPIHAEDEALYPEFVARLEPEDLRLRFFGPPRELTHDELMHLTRIDFTREMALVAVRKLSDSKVELLGVIRAVTEANGTDAELGIIVRSDIKAEGLGWLLMRKLLTYVRGQGLKRLIAYVLHENLVMREFAESNGFVVDAAAGDGQAMCFVLDLRGSRLCTADARTLFSGVV